MTDDAKISNGKAEVPGTAAFSKFMKVLQAVSDHDGEPSIAQIAKDCGLPRPTVYRIVAALLAEGMLMEPKPGGGLSLGPRLISLAGRSWHRSDVRQAAQRPLARLRDTIDETIHLAVNSGDEMIYIDKLESRRTVRMASRVGTRVPMYSSSVGKAWLAAMPESAAKLRLAQLQLFPRTTKTITDVETLLIDLSECRGRGYSLDLEENELEICCYGRVIVNHSGSAVGCISVSMPRYRFEAAPREAIVDAMSDCVTDIAKLLGDD